MLDIIWIIAFLFRSKRTIKRLENLIKQIILVYYGDAKILKKASCKKLKSFPLIYL
jgi:hypothetical protein